MLLRTITAGLADTAIDVEAFRATPKEKRWEIVRLLKELADTQDAYDIMDEMRAVEGRPVPKYPIGMKFRPSNGTTVYEIVGFRWWNQWGCWGYRGFSEKWGDYAQGHFFERAPYYGAATLEPIHAEKELDTAQALA